MPPAATHASLPSEGLPTISSDGAANTLNPPQTASETVQTVIASGAVSPTNHQLPPAATYASLPSKGQPKVSSEGAASELDRPQTASEIVETVTASGAVYPQNNPDMLPAVTQPAMPSQGQPKGQPPQTANETVQQASTQVQANQTTDSQVGKINYFIMKTSGYAPR